MNVMRYVKIGLFFLSLGTAGTVYVVMSSDGFNRFNTRDYDVIMDDATGLSTNSKVYLAGVPVGKIREIDLEGGRAVLKVSFLKGTDIHSDAMISRRSSSILGTSILALDPGSAGMPSILPGGRLGSIAGGAGGTVDFTAMAASVQDLSVRLSALLEETFAILNSTLVAFDNRTAVEFDRVARILEASALVSERLERILREREGDLGSSAVEARLAIENIRAITDGIRNGEGTVGRAVNDDELYVGIQNTLESVNALAEDAGSLVSKASRLDVQVDSIARYDVLSGNVRAAASLRLEPGSGDRWYRVGVGSAPDGIVTRTVTDTTEGGETVRTEKSETVSGFTIDAELARSVGMFTLRGGLLESTAGLGLDFSPDDWLTVSGEVFDFRSGRMPNLRGSVTIYPFFDPASGLPWNWLYFRAGVTAALDDRRDWFFGAGVRFSDEEVRSLVGLIPLEGLQ